MNPRDSGFIAGSDTWSCERQQARECLLIAPTPMPTTMIAQGDKDIQEVAEGRVSGDGSMGEVHAGPRQGLFGLASAFCHINHCRVKQLGANATPLLGGWGRWSGHMPIVTLTIRA